MAPARSADLRPPLIRIGERNGMVGRGKHHRTRHQALGRRPGKIFGARRSLGHGDVTRRLHEARRTVRSSLRSHPSRSRPRRRDAPVGNQSWPASRQRRACPAGPAPPSRIPRRESTPCRRAQVRAADSCFRRSEEMRADGSASAAGGLERIVVRARTTAPVIGTMATHAHALLLRRGTDTVLIGFERRLLICGSGRISRESSERTRVRGCLKPAASTQRYPRLAGPGHEIP